MTVESMRCRSCGGEAHGVAPCPPSLSLVRDEVVNPTCNCLPSAPDSWLACAHCGLPQAPGKAFCAFCGNRWQAEVPAAGN